MVEDTETASDEQVRTSGHVERTILHSLVEDGRYVPTTVSDVLDPIASVIDRGGYDNIGPNGAADVTVRKSTVRRAFARLRDKGLVRRVSDLDPSDIRDDRVDLGQLPDDGDPDDPTAYSRTSDDARVTDWILTDEGRRELQRLDAQYAEELDELAARYGRPAGETTARVDA